MTSLRTLVVVAIVAGLLGGVVGAMAVGLIGDEGDSRGQILEVPGELGFVDGMWCSPHHRFCIPEYEDPSEVRAFYMMETHEYTREMGCGVVWDPDREVSGYESVRSDERGAFVGQCPGSLWLRNGTLIRGPGPRDLDEFAVEIEERVSRSDGEEVRYQVLVVDTRELICGREGDGERAEECEFAPPFE